MKKKKPSPRKRQLDPALLPQAATTWGTIVQQLRFWITPPDEPPTRPYLIMVADLSRDFIMGQNLLDHAPAPDEIHQVILTAITKPSKGTGRPHRPERIVFDNPTVTDSLAPILSAIGISAETGDLSMIHPIIRDLETHMRGGEQHPGLLSVAGVTPGMAGSFFAAAANFYRAAPWVKLRNEDAFAIRFPADGGKTRIAVTMGNSGVEYGLVVYNNWADVEKLYSGIDDPKEALPPEGALTMFYEGVSQLPMADYEAMQQYEWEVADDERAHPVPVFFPREGGVRRPNPEELAWLTAALRAIPILVSEHLRPDGRGGYQPLEMTFNIPTHTGEAAVYAKYPAGIIRYENLPAQEPEWPEEEEGESSEEEVPVLDRRMMEGMMAHMMGGLGAAPVSDRKLQKAQELMYQAWEETNPVKRLSLAHKALTISPNCADAYVLLAEEQADTVVRALEFYQKGVEAGERALGPDYFKHEVGNFWGLLETRPYMRARQGLADCLWKLNRLDEAVAHCQELLRLNPGDNQGIRYLLVALFLDMDRDDNLINLLKQYKDDAMATWLYTWALAEFRKSGIGKQSDRRLKDALKQNPHVPAYLTARKRIPNRLPPYMGWGDEAEAMHYAADHLNHWRRTPGAIEWLKSKL
jgi:tetratricopeptide (TPR) repeat protein